MFKEGTYVTALGKFQIKAVGPEYVEADSYGTGQVENVNKYAENGFTEVTENGLSKEFDGFQLGAFFAFNGKYKVVRSNDIFTKIELEGHMLSLPNHKLMEVE